jgi:hypothetical protein
VCVCGVCRLVCLHLVGSRVSVCIILLQSMVVGGIYFAGLGLSVSHLADSFGLWLAPCTRWCGQCTASTAAHPSTPPNQHLICRRWESGGRDGISGGCWVFWLSIRPERQLGGSDDDLPGWVDLRVMALQRGCVHSLVVCKEDGHARSFPRTFLPDFLRKNGRKIHLCCRVVWSGRRRHACMCG